MDPAMQQLQELQVWATVAAAVVGALTFLALLFGTPSKRTDYAKLPRLRAKSLCPPTFPSTSFQAVSWLNFINVEIANFGSTPAHNIRLRAEPDFEYRKNEFISQLGPSKNGINHLPPSGKVVFFLGSVIEFKAAGRLDSTFSVSADYEDRNGTTFHHQYEISLKFLEGLSSIDRDPAISIADNFEALKKAVESWASEAMKEIDRKRWEKDSYFYRSPVGVFWIRPLTGRVGHYQLGIDNLPLHEHYSPYEAAEAVHKQRTGYAGWDSRPDIKSPSDLTEWTAGEIPIVIGPAEKKAKEQTVAR